MNFSPAARLMRSVAKRRWTRRQGPIFADLGTLIVGDNVVFAPGPVRSQLVVGHGAECVIGDGVYVAYGTSISCGLKISIGERCRLGPFAIIYDSDFHTVGYHDLRTPGEEPSPETSPVQIGSDVVVGAWATILRGSSIGDGCVIEPGSVVWGNVPAGGRVIGDPRTIRET